ncbi:MAG: RluA family pseudouridine synthase [Dorea sp.]|nr:RluA family pseudouridine synthase [Dorea sp.]
MLSNNLNILYEDSDIIVIVKPAGIATQSKKVGSPDLVNLIKRYLYIKNPRGGEPYLAVIHRLDQPVKGILVFAKNKKAATLLNKQLNHGHNEYGFNKFYLATVHGRPEKESGDLVDYIISDSRTNTSRICKKGTPMSKEARLHYELLSTIDTEDGMISELEIHLDTGRRHQIRVQLANMGCPIVGDTKYNPLEQTQPVEKKRFARSGEKNGTKTYKELKLCAFHLQFNHPSTGRFMDFEIAA